MLKIIVALTGNRTPNSHVKNDSCIGRESNPDLPRGRGTINAFNLPAQSLGILPLNHQCQ